MPVSDRVTVLAKAFVPLVILPLLTFVVIVVTQLIMLLVSTVALAPSGLAGTTWALLPLPRLAIILLYGLVTSALWEAPVYAWLLLVGGYARRATFLWAVLPWLALCAIEKLVLRTSYLAELLNRRITGGFEVGFDIAHQPKGHHVPMVDRLAHFDPQHFLSSPGLWLGLIVATAFVAGAIQLRRVRGPL